MHLRNRTRRSHAKVKRAIASCWGPIESLEGRRLLDATAYPIAKLYDNSTSWAQLPDQTNGQTYYVSSSLGDDNNPGTSPDEPFATLAKAKSKMLDGHDDRMLLLRGDVWDEPIGAWSTSGIQNADGSIDPQVISYYSLDPNNTFAGDRPLIDSGTNDGIFFTGHASNVAIIGLQFSPNSINGASYDGTNSAGVAGMRFQLNGSNYLVEDCLVDGYKDNIVVGNPGDVVNDFVLHRSESLDSYNATGAHSQGLYVSGACQNVLIEENTFDHNGWNDNVEGADKTFFNHNMYINTGATNVQVLNNTITRGSLRGTLLRAGGTVEGNFYDQNAVGIQVDNTASTVENNVILEGDDLPSLPSGVGIDVSFDIPSVDIENNIVAHDISDYTYNVSGINLNDGTQAATVDGNIVYDWRRPLIDGVDNSATIQHNDFEEFSDHHAIIDLRGSGGDFGSNTYYNPTVGTAFEKSDNLRESYTTWTGQQSDNSKFIGVNTPSLNYIDPNRSMATYAATLGLPADQQTFDGWVALQRQQSNGNWNASLTATAEDAYIRQGFTPEGTAIADSIPRVSVSLNTNAISETDAGATFTFTRETGGLTPSPITAGTMSINYQITGTATNGVDYTLSPSTVFFQDGQSTATVTLIPIHDKNADGSFNVEQPETAKIQVTASSANPVTYVPGLQPSATLTINDADGGNTPVTPPGGGTGPVIPPPDTTKGDSGGDDDQGGSGDNSGSGANPSGTGLTASYYNNQDLSGTPVLTKTTSDVSIDVAAGAANGTVKPGVNTNYFSVAYTGAIQPPQDGNYTFQIGVDADAAVRMYVDDGSDDGAQVELYANHRMADANDDASVNSADFDILAAHFGQTNTVWKTGDFNGDGITNTLDFNALASNYGTSDPRGTAQQTLTGTVSLEGGAAYNIRLEYAQKVGNAQLSFMWKGPGISSFTTPGSENRLYPGQGPVGQSAFSPDTSSDQILIPAASGAAPASQTASASSLFSSTQISNDKDVLG